MANKIKHGMKGLIGAERAKTYTPSAYAGGDRGGSAGGYGLSHGAAGAPGAKPMAVAPTYGGAPMHFEGGTRGGAVSEPETMPGAYEYGKKGGYDEHKASKRGGGVHGVAGAEGMPAHAHGDDGDGDDESRDGMGARCGMAGCGFTAKTPHGLARHAIKKHKRMAIGHALMGRSHGMSGQVRGETENSSDQAKIRAEYTKAKGRIMSNPSTHAESCSSYGSGDRGGSHGCKY